MQRIVAGWKKIGKELQSLVIGYFPSGETPVSNLKIATDTLLEKPMAAERTNIFIRESAHKTDKLDFLFRRL